MRSGLCVWAVAPTLLALAGPAYGQRTGMVRGIVMHDGVTPGSEWLRVTTDRDVCGDSVESRHVLVERGRVQNALAVLEGVPSIPTAAPSVVLTNRRCNFDPPVLVARQGATLVLRNDDPVMHNVHLYHMKRTVANVSIPMRGIELQNRRALTRPGPVEVKCDAHGWMRATVWVVDHPYYALTNADGSFEIRDVPPGRYTVTVLHPVLGERRQGLEVTTGAPTTVEFRYPRQE